MTCRWKSDNMKTVSNIFGVLDFDLEDTVINFSLNNKITIIKVLKLF